MNRAGKNDGSAQDRAHRDPRNLLERLRALLIQPTADLAAIDRGFAELTVFLEKRFADEETNGHFEEAVGRAPWLTVAAQNLQREHADLLNEIREAAAPLRRPTEEPLVRRVLQARFDRFAERYLEHEADEANFLQEAYGQANQDFGP